MPEPTVSSSLQDNNAVNIPATVKAKPKQSTSVTQPQSRNRLVGGLVLGLVGGIVGSFILIRYYPGVIPTSRQQVVVQESSAVVDVAKKLSPSVVSITTETVSSGQSLFGFRSSGSSTSEAAGTGMIISSNGLILTNNHVISGSSTITVFTSDGKQHKATLVAANTSQDYAFIKIDATGLTPVKLGNSDNVQIGQSVIAIGNALGEFNNTVTDGIISGKGRPVDAGDASGTSQTESLQDLFQTDAAINEGNSGGPLVDLNGDVIGMNTAVASDAQNIGFAIPINEIKTAIQSVEQKGTINQPYLGVHYLPITADVAATYKLSVTAGAYVTADSGTASVVAGSPAEKAGIKDGDVITKVGGTTVDSSHSLTSLLAQHKPGDKISITILRMGKTMTLTATLATMPKQ